jgi:hypothetical protein
MESCSVTYCNLSQLYTQHKDLVSLAGEDPKAFNSLEELIALSNKIRVLITEKIPDVKLKKV